MHTPEGLAPKWKGILPVVPTPLKTDGRFDAHGMSYLVDFYINAGCHGLLILGSGGEFPYFSMKEKYRIIQTTVDMVGGRVPVCVGMGYFGLAESLEFIAMTDALGFNGYLMAQPSYYPVRIGDAVDLFTTAVKATSKSIFFYHYPQVTGFSPTPEETASILNIPGITGSKDSSINIRSMRKTLFLVEKNSCSYFSGVGFLLLETLRSGGVGAMCPVATVAPHLVVECYEAWRQKDEPKAAALQDEIMAFLPLINTFELSPYLQKKGFHLISHLPFARTARTGSRHAVTKEMLRQMGFPITSIVRSPLPQISPREKQQVSRLLGNALRSLTNFNTINDRGK